MQGAREVTHSIIFEVKLPEMAFSPGNWQVVANVCNNEGQRPSFLPEPHHGRREGTAPSHLGSSVSTCLHTVGLCSALSRGWALAASVASLSRLEGVCPALV